MERIRQRQGRDKVKNTKAFNLFKRLVEFKEETLRFMTNLNIPFDNNGSEQDIRNGKVKQKNIGLYQKQERSEMVLPDTKLCFIGEKAGSECF